MSVTHYLTEEEISPLGIVSGDEDPSVTQDGVFTKLREIAAEIEADLSALAALWDAHDHSNNGQPIGTGGAPAIGPAQVIQAIIRAGAITGAKTAPGAITSANIPDDSVEKEQIGAPLSSTRSATGTGDVSFVLQGATDVPLFHVETDHPSSNSLITVRLNVATVIVHHVFGGMTANITCRAYGCTGIG